MAVFEYRALNAQGKHKKGVIEADSERQVRQLLREQGLSPLSLQAVAAAKKSTSSGLFVKVLSIADLALFTRELHTLLEASTPLNQALKALAEQAQSRHMQRFISSLSDRVSGGYGFAQSLQMAPFKVAKDYIAIVQAGEESGHLTAVLSRLADAIEQREQLNKKLKTALIYPSLMVVVAVAIVFFLMIYVVPKVVTVFDSMQQTLPPLTQGLLSMSAFMQAYWPLILGAVALIWLGFKLAMRYPAPRFKWHQLLLRLPGIKGFLVYSATASWARTFGVLLASGVTVREALLISSEVMTLDPLRKKVDEMVLEVREGKSVHRAMVGAGFFPPLLLNLVQTGEGKGQLHTMLLNGARHYEQSVENSATTLMSLLEPILIIVMGAVVLTIVMAIMMPIFEMNQMVS